MENQKNNSRKIWGMLLGLGILLMVVGAWQGSRYDDLKKRINDSDEHRSLRYIYEQQAILYKSNYGFSGEVQDRLRAREKELEATLEKKFPKHSRVSSGSFSQVSGVLLIFVSILGILSTPRLNK